MSVAWCTLVTSTVNQSLLNCVLYTTYNEYNQVLLFRVIANNMIYVYNTNLDQLYRAVLQSNSIDTNINMLHTTGSLLRQLRYGVVSYNIHNNNDDELVLQWNNTNTNELDICVTLYNSITGANPYTQQYYTILNEIDRWCTTLQSSLYNIQQLQSDHQSTIDKLLSDIDKQIHIKNDMESIIYNKTHQLIQSKQNQLNQLDIQIHVLQNEIIELGGNIDDNDMIVNIDTDSSNLVDGINNEIMHNNTADTDDSSDDNELQDNYTTDEDNNIDGPQSDQHNNSEDDTVTQLTQSTINANDSTYHNINPPTVLSGTTQQSIPSIHTQLLPDTQPTAESIPPSSNTPLTKRPKLKRQL